MSKGWLTSDFFVKDSLAILNYYTQKKWERKSVSELPFEIKENEYTVMIWYNQRTGYTHFRRRYFDTLTDSVTVREGTIQGYYIYSVKG